MKTAFTTLEILDIIEDVTDELQAEVNQAEAQGDRGTANALRMEAGGLKRVNNKLKQAIQGGADNETTKGHN